MITSLDAALLHLFVVLLIPLVLWSLWAGSPIPNRPLGEYFRAVKGLRFAGDLFLVSLCAMSLIKLSIYFGFLEPARGKDVLFYLSAPFIVLLLVYLGLLVKAVRRVHYG